MFASQHLSLFLFQSIYLPVYLIYLYICPFPQSYLTLYLSIYLYIFLYARLEPVTASHKHFLTLSLSLPL